MATIDSLDIQIEGSAQKANQAIDSLITNLGRLANSLKIDTSGLEKIGKSLNFSGIDKAAKNIQSQTQKASKSLSQITEQYKDLGKGFEIKGSTQQIQKQIDSLTNQLEKAKLAKEDFETSGKTNLGGYETAVKNVIKYENQIESLKNQISEIKSAKPIDFKITGIETAESKIYNISEKLRKVSLPQSAFNYNADAMKAVFGDVVAGIENWSQATQKFGVNAGAVLNQTSAKTDELKARTEQFEQYLKNLQIPPINTENINVLQRELAKSEANFEKLRTKLANGIAMGRISANVDDKGFRNLKEQMALAEKTAEALRDKINEVGKASQGAAEIKEVGKASEKASNSFSKLSKNSLKASGSLKKMQSSLKGVLRALLPILGIRELVRFGKESIKSSMDYLEILNYFDAAFEQVASKADLSAFEKMGYESAEAYYGSFAQRAGQLTEKMSGFTVGEGGLLESTGDVSLGLDPNRLMNYQAMFAQMSSSMGVASETSLKLSQALTEIGADLASIKNMDFEDVWNDMASGLSGMSRTLDKYGVNIRNVNLQQKLNELGINANISALNQNDKALLRAIILLENTKYAWGDLADTINQPANQLRLIEANFQNLSRTVGNLFLPIMKTVLPYINALVIALQRLFSWLGSLIGIDISDISTSIGGTDIGGILDQTDDLSDGLGGVAENAKKAKAGLRAFDELKTISMPEESKDGMGAGGIGGGLLDAAFQDAFSEYQKTWDEAFGKLENRAQELADKIEKAFEPIKKIIQDFAIGDFFQAGKDTSAIVVSIFDFFADAIDRVDWEQIGQNIGDFLAGLDWTAIFKAAGNLMWQGLKAAFELWKGSFEAAPIETAFLTILALPSIVGFGSKLIGLIVNPFKNIFGLLSPIISGIGGLFAEGGVFGAGGLIASASAPVLVLVGAFAALVAGLAYVFATNEEVRESFFQAVSAIKDGLQPAIEFVTNTLLPDLNAGWERLLEILSPLGEFLNGVFVSIWQDMINPALTYIGETVLPKLTEAFENLWNNVLVPLGKFLGDVLEPVIIIVSDLLKILWKNIVIKLAKAIGNILSKAFEGICDIFNETVIPIVNAVIDVFQFLWDNVFSPIVDFLWDTFKPVFEDVFEAIGGIIDGLSQVFGGLIDFIVGVFTLDWEKAWNGIVNVFKGIFETIKNIVKNVMDSAIEIVNGVIRSINKISSSLGLPKIMEIGEIKEYGFKNESTFSKNNQGLINYWSEIGEKIGETVNKKIENAISKDFSVGIEIDGKNISKSKVTMKSFSSYDSGGFPEDGWFRASHGEIMGRFDNGQSVVANNNQITQGIADAVYPAVYNAVSSAIKNNGAGRSSDEVRVFVGNREITDFVIEEINERTRRRGKTPIELFV